MKILRIFDKDGVLLVYNLINLEGDDFTLRTSIPLFLPIVGVSITDPDDEEGENEECQ